MSREEWTVKIYSDPREADEEDRAYYKSLTPQQRLDLLVDMLNRWGKLNELKFERVMEIVHVPPDASREKDSDLQ